jgi:hypothetical protein
LRMGNAVALAQKNAESPGNLLTSKKLASRQINAGTIEYIIIIV